MLIFEYYRNREQTVEAAQWTDVSEIGEIVDNLFAEGCRTITVMSVPKNPQLAESSQVDSISYSYNGKIGTIFLGDYLVFFNDDTEVSIASFTEDEFNNTFELVE